MARGSKRRETLPHNTMNGVTVGIWREWFRGHPVVVKEIGRRGDVPAHWLPSDVPQHWNYWQREVLAYRSGLPARLGLGAPDLLDVVAREGGLVQLKLESVEGRTGAALTLDDVAAAAHALGHSQGRPSGRETATDPWLSHGFLRAYTASKPFDRTVLDDDAFWRHDAIVEHLAPLRPALVALRDDREALLALVESCPRAVCHLDAWMNNVIRRPDGEVVFIDWAFAGDGAIGEDASNLVIDSVMDLLWPVDRLDELAEAVWRSYLAGLRSAGWDGDERLVRLALCAAAVKYEWLAVVVLLQTAQGSGHAYGAAAAPDTLVAARAAGLRLVCAWADEARRLADALGRG